MQITITFDSWEELEAFRYSITEKPKNFHVGDTIEVATPEPTIPKDTVVVNIPNKDTVVVNAKDLAVTMNADTAEAIAAPTEPDYELLRLDVRKVLADLNKAQSGKPAQKLIKEMGFNGLSDVPGERLQELMDKAKEMM